jgi:hypothetical protein
VNEAVDHMARQALDVADAAAVVDGNVGLIESRGG